MREELLAAVRMRVGKIEASGDLSIALEPDASQEIRRLALLLHADMNNLDIRMELGRIRWYRAQALPEDQRFAEESAAIEAFTRCLRFGRVAGVPSKLLPRIAQQVSWEAEQVLQDAMNSSSAAEAIDAVALWQRIVRATPADSPDRPLLLSNLVVALHTRYDREGKSQDLRAALEFFPEILESTSPVDYYFPARVSNFGICLMSRWERTGNLADLDAAVEQLRRAVAVTPENDPRRIGPLVNLGNALRRRSGLLGTSVDLDAAIAYLGEAARLIPPGSSKRAAVLSALGISLSTRYDRLGAVGDSGRALDALRETVKVTPTDAPDRAGHLSNLGVALLGRFSQGGEHADLDEALDLCSEAVRLSPPGNLDRARHLSVLAGALRTRAAHTVAPEDLDSAIPLLRQALQETSVEHPNRAWYLTDLGAALHERFFTILRDRRDNLRGASTADLHAAVQAWTEASEVDTAPTHQRILAAWSASRELARTNSDAAADIAEAAVQLLPRLAPRRLDRGDQQHGLGAFPGLAAEAASLALATSHGNAEDRAARALRLLEAGRAVLLGQALDVRSDLTVLRRQHPVIAARFTELRDRLDRPLESVDTGPLETWDGKALFGSERAVAERQRLATEFGVLLEEIRGLPGLSYFGLPPALDHLLSETWAGPIVVVNISRYRSDAILLTGSGVQALRLPELTAKDVFHRSQAFREALLQANAPGGVARRRRAQAVLTGTLEWLWDVVAEPVLEALGYREQHVGGSEWPRVWWVPGGPLAQLPLHAAGYHADAREMPRRRTVMDRVVSSYTPTVRALRHAREQQARRREETEHATRDPVRALIVAMPTTPDHADLEHVLDEVSVVQTHLPDAALLAGPDRTGDSSVPLSAAPTRQRVLERLANCTVAHFACHGESDREDPSRSRLLLCDHQEAPLTVAELGAVHLDRAELAYLSACRTTVVEIGSLADEPIHLTAALQIAGFPHVIGTLWEIDDETAVTVADAFYAGLRAGTRSIEPDRAACALHIAMRALRDRLPRVPSLWAGYLHAGA
jgi:tetratricopeptide (TPR) repeat protein